MLFNENLKKYRFKAGFKSAKQFSKILNVPYTTYMGYENKNSWPPEKTLLKIAAALGVDVNTLVGYEKEKTAGQVGKDDYKELIQVINEVSDLLFDCLELLPDDKAETAAETIAEAIKLTESGLVIAKDIYTAFLEAENKRLLNSAVNAGGYVPETVGHISEQGQGLPDLMAGK